MKRYGVTGYKGKLGRLLLERPNFVPIGADITKAGELLAYHEPFDVIVNCAAISSIDACESDFEKAIEVNKRGLHNLHKVFGSRILNISSDQVFSGNDWFLPKENSYRSPVNNYGFSKLGAEEVSRVDGGKTLRLSRSVSMKDLDIGKYYERLVHGEDIEVPKFFFRNYLHREQAVDGIEYFVNNYDDMPQEVNYGSLNNFSYYKLMLELSKRFDLPGKVQPRKIELSLTPRPKRGGFNVSLSKKLGFPMYKLSDTVSKLVEEV